MKEKEILYSFIYLLNQSQVLIVNESKEIKLGTNDNKNNNVV
jgi:hypothetical protein